jgi:hypothetical protein
MFRLDSTGQSAEADTGEPVINLHLSWTVEITVMTIPACAFL